MDFKQKYLKYKNKYIKLKNQLSQTGGDMNVSKSRIHEYDSLAKKFNSVSFNDTGDNGVWMFTDKTNSLCKTTDCTEKKFHIDLTNIVDKRNSIRQKSLQNLLNLIKVKKLKYETPNGLDVYNLDFIMYFYNYIFRGKTHKFLFPIGKDISYPDDINIFSEIIKAKDASQAQAKQDVKSNTLRLLSNKGEQIRHFMFLDKKNPCHITESINKFQGDKKNFYVFKPGKVLGEGAAGRAMNFNFKYNEEEKTYLALKVMDGSTFTLENNGEYLSTDLVFFKKGITQPSFPNVFDFYGNRRYYLPLDYKESIYERRWPEFSRYNTFEVGGTGDHITLAVQSDNFTNQTILSMIINHIMTENKCENYVHQYDAFMCLNIDTDANVVDETERDNESTFTSIMRKTFEGIKTTGKYFIEQMADTFDTTTENVKLNGVTIMDVANQGDLDSYIRRMTRTEFSEFNPNTTVNDKVYEEVTVFFNNVIEQIMKPLDLLHSSKYAFVHGDMKSKNVFVHKKEDGTIVYKLADFDKSSINFNGVRFHNSGDGIIKSIKKLTGSKFLHIHDVKNLKVDEKTIKVQTEPGQPEDTQPDVVQLDNLESEDTPSSEQEQPQEHTPPEEYTQPPKDEDPKYNLNSFIISLSRNPALKKLQSVEIEQLSVRYYPIPFYQTFDIYTFVSSLFFTNLFYMFIKIAFETEYKGDEGELEKLKDNKMYKLFKELFEYEDQIVMLKYFETYYRSSLLEEVSINAILDPIKKNEIKMFKRYSEGIKELFDLKYSCGSTHTDLDKDENMTSKLYVSNGSIIKNSEQLCLTYPAIDFKRKFFRGGETMYINEEYNVSVFNKTGVSEALKGIDPGNAKQEINRDIFKLKEFFDKNKEEPNVKELIELMKIENIEDKFIVYRKKFVEYLYKLKGKKVEHIDFFKEIKWGLMVYSFPNNIRDIIIGVKELLDNNIQYNIYDSEKFNTDFLGYIHEENVNIHSIKNVCRTPTYKTPLGVKYNWDYYTEDVDEGETINKPKYTNFIEYIINKHKENYPRETN